MDTKLDKLVARSQIDGHTYKEGDQVQATVALGRDIPVGKFGVVIDTFGKFPNEGYEIDFLPNGGSVTVIPYQIEPRRPKSTATKQAEPSTLPPNFESRDLLLLQPGQSQPQGASK